MNKTGILEPLEEGNGCSVELGTELIVREIQVRKIGERSERFEGEETREPVVSEIERSDLSAVEDLGRERAGERAVGEVDGEDGRGTVFPEKGEGEVERGEAGASLQVDEEEEGGAGGIVREIAEVGGDDGELEDVGEVGGSGVAVAERGVAEAVAGYGGEKVGRRWLVQLVDEER